MRKLLLVIAGSLALTGCFDSDDDDEIKENTAPEAVSEAFTTQADTAFTDTLTATDADGDALTFSIDSAATLGTVDLMSDGQFTYTPNPQVTGNDSFTFQVSDGEATATGTIEVTIEALTVSFAAYTRTAFAQDASATPLPVNGRDFTQDADDPDAFDDLLMD
ncbi:cadherin-like domain-containing protein [Alteromonas sp. ASW11-19]|uniref:Cadherin-like domain-containing protein n=1 Tax=Alteromonas salexigens TaxID=2982530 RepID=A0ABT2VPT5_9ALTE|nr:cadherin-like domain-containing protein [Alteromonas salexigens]MCU7555337.1 cadherin-like domain-containing protein [Alteromonas salexigens]